MKFLSLIAMAAATLTTVVAHNTANATTKAAKMEAAIDTKGEAVMDAQMEAMADLQALAATLPPCAVWNGP